MGKRSEIQAQLKEKSIAIASGKGGVGKSTTAVNLSIYYAKVGIRVALLDMDPLSDISTILDLEAPEDTLKERPEGKEFTLSTYTQPVFSNLDLLFPRTKLRRGESLELFRKALELHGELWNQRYDLLIYDLPAGIGQEENLTFLSYVDKLIVVTNAEPTSHVSAGGYIKAALEVAPHLKLYFWHNKYSLVQENGFNPRQVIENYNRHVPEELRIDRSRLQAIKDIAFIPHDPSLDLLQNNLSLEGSVHLKLLESCEVLQKKLLAAIPDNLPMDVNGKNLIKHYLSSLRSLPPSPKLAAQVEEYYGAFYRGTSTPTIGKFLAKKKLSEFSEPLRKELVTYIENIRNHRLRNRLLEVIVLLEQTIEALKDSRRLFAVSSSRAHPKKLHDKIVSLLTEAVSHKGLESFDRNLLGLVLFYFSLSKIIVFPSVQQLFFNFVPKRKNSKGAWIRDKNKQIHYLVEKDLEYHKQYFLLIKKLFPVVLKQISHLIETYPVLGAWILKQRDGEANRAAYLKLLTSFVHDAIHAGLGVFIGFKFNTASEAIKQGARNLLSELDQKEVLQKKLAT